MDQPKALTPEQWDTLLGTRDNDPFFQVFGPNADLTPVPPGGIAQDATEATDGEETTEGHGDTTTDLTLFPTPHTADRQVITQIRASVTGDLDRAATEDRRNGVTRTDHLDPAQVAQRIVLTRVRRILDDQAVLHTSDSDVIAQITSYLLTVIATRGKAGDQAIPSAYGAASRLLFLARCVESDPAA